MNVFWSGVLLETGKFYYLFSVEGEKEGTEYPCENNVCGQEYFELPIGKTSVKFTASDRTGNTASCIFTVTVKG